MTNLLAAPFLPPRAMSNEAAARLTKLWIDTSFIMADAAMVIALRSMKMLAGGPAATREAERMVGEKVEAGFEFAGAIASGRVRSPEAAARKALSVSKRRIRANRKRLG